MKTGITPKPKSKVLIVGGPDAGKTNFFGRLWLATEDGRSALSRNGLPDDLTYLTDVIESILQGKYAPRTSTDQPETIGIPFKSSKNSDQIGILEIPDFRGESWLTVYRHREWPTSWDAYLDGLCGCLLFLRVASTQIQPALDWVTIEAIFREKVQIAAPREIPTQVLLVDWLQMIDSCIEFNAISRGKIRLGIVITAWDRVPNEQHDADPREWLRSNFPMFDQYLGTCGDKYEIAVFGVSAFGGDLNDEVGYAQEFLATGPQQCGYTVYMNGTNFTKQVDVTIPVAWSLGIQIP